MNRAKFSETLTFLAEVATYSGPDEYSVTELEVGYKPIKNGLDMTHAIGKGFLPISRWLLDVTDKNLNCK